MFRTRFSNLATAACLAACAAFSAPSQAQVAVAETPLFLQQPIKPAFIMGLDDSGSMSWEVLISGNRDGWAVFNEAAGSFFNADGTSRKATGDGGAGQNRVNFLDLFPFPGRTNRLRAIPPISNFGFSRSHEFNPQYYNPSIVYTPWRRAEPPHWPDANPRAAVPDPRRAVSAANNPAFDLTENIREAGNDWRFNVFAGMVIPAGTEYNRNVNCAGVPGGQNAWLTQPTDFVITQAGGCVLRFSYYAPTFYLTESSFPGYTATPLAVTGPVGGPPGTTLYRYEIKPGNMSAAAYSEQIQNFANWFTYYRNRNLLTIASASEALSDIEFMRIGAFYINNRIQVTMRDLEVPADKEALYSFVHALPASGGTPSRASVNHMGLQFRRTNAGAPIPSDPNLGGACQVNAGMLFTDGYTNDGTSITVGNVDGGMGSPFADTFNNTIADVAARHYLDNIRPGVEEGRMRVPAACSNPTPDPRLDCRRDPHMNFYGVTLGALGNVFGVDEAATADPFSNPPAWQADVNLTPASIDALWHATLNARGRMINATTPAQVAQAFRDVLRDIGEKARPAGGVAASATRRDGDFLVYVPEFASEDWTGNVKAFQLGPNGALGAEAWDASQKLGARAPSTRQIFVSVPSGAGFGLSNFEPGSLGGEAGVSGLLGIGPADFADYGGSVSASDVLGYLRGESGLEQRNGGPLRDRTSRIGDILGSQPEVTGRASFGYTNLPASEGGGVSGPGSYGAFLEFKRDRRPVLFVGTNAGVLHAFDARAGASGGDELFAVIPNGSLPRMKELPKLDYAHLHMLDGSPVQADARVGAAWRTVLAVPGGLGSRSVMMLDVTNAATSFGADNFMWEFQDAGLGLAMSRPRVVRLQGGRWVAMFGNGVNSDDNRSRLFVLDLATGAPLQIIQPDAEGTGANPNGMIALAAVDSDFDGGVDTIYTGDLQGRVYKMAVSDTGAISLANGGSPLFRALDINNNPQPITGGMDAALHHLRGNMLYFGTGRFFAENDNVVPAAPSPWPQVHSFYGIWDDPSAATGTINRAQLQQQQIVGEVATADGPARRVTQNSIDWNSSRGFFLDLRRQDAIGSTARGIRGERAVGQPRVVQGSILFTSFTPVGDPCGSGGINRVYVLNALTGAANLGVSEPACPDCAGVSLPDGPPLLNPPVAANRKETNRDPNLPPLLDADGNVIAADATCVLELSLIVESGARLLRQTTCGRAAWRQIE
ncbi:MAG: hypothetical protein MEQ07_11250 [Aquimonas sp.]|nr:hypothetical protein [Aquimonas sp.]